MERKLGEIDRARAIFMYASQFCDPRVVVSLWREWHKFEVQHGNEETFREMLRVKRSVQVTMCTRMLAGAHVRSTRSTALVVVNPNPARLLQPGSLQPDQLHGCGNAHRDPRRPVRRCSYQKGCSETGAPLPDHLAAPPRSILCLDPRVHHLLLPYRPVWKDATTPALRPPWRELSARRVELSRKKRAACPLWRARLRG